MSCNTEEYLVLTFIHDSCHVLYRHRAIDGFHLKVLCNDLIHAREGFYRNKIFERITSNLILYAQFVFKQLCPLLIEFTILTAITPITHEDVSLVLKLCTFKVAIHIVTEQSDKQVFYLATACAAKIQLNFFPIQVSKIAFAQFVKHG